MKYIYSNLFRFIRRFPEIGYPQSSSIYGWISHYKPSILGYPHDYGNFHILHANLPIFEVRRILERREAAWPRALHHHGLWAAEAVMRSLKVAKVYFSQQQYSGFPSMEVKKSKNGWFINGKIRKILGWKFGGVAPMMLGNPMDLCGSNQEFFGAVWSRLNCGVRMMGYFLGIDISYNIW